MLGWLLGSFINFSADSLPGTRRLKPVNCSSCGAVRSLHSYLLMRPCLSCGKGVGKRAWIVQCLAVLVTVVQWAAPSPRLGFWVGAVLLTYFAIVAVIDIEHRLILYEESAVGAILGLAIGIWLHGLPATLLGGFAGAAIMAGLFILGWALAKWFGKLRGQPIEEDALGFSDILLSGILGFLLGWPGILAGIFYTIFIAGGGSLLILLIQLFRRKYEPFVPVAFGPYLLLAGVILIYWPK